MSDDEWHTGDWALYQIYEVRHPEDGEVHGIEFHCDDNRVFFCQTHPSDRSLPGIRCGYLNIPGAQRTRIEFPKMDDGTYDFCRMSDVVLSL